jgi:hypothetical protein
MRFFCAAAMMIALLAGPAYAQTQIPRYGEIKGAKTPKEIEEERAAEKAYKRSLGNIPDQAPTDPWGNARSVSEPKAGAKTAPAKPQAKTGGAAN